MQKAIIALLILISTCSYSQEKVTEQINIPFKVSPNGHIMIQAKVNGVEGTFVFDTGAGINLLTKEFADKVNDLEKTDHFYTGHRATGEELQTDLWKAKTLEIGTFKIQDGTVTVFDFDFPLDGLISLTPFKNTPITIDFENKVLSIESSKSLKERVSNQDFEMPIQIANDRDITIGIATKIQLDNKLALNVSLDSGAGFGVYRFSSRYMKTLGIDSTNIESEYKKSYFKPEDGNTYYYTNVSKMSDFNTNTSITDFKATFIDGLIYEGIMGIDWIGEVITIDIPEKRLIVKK